ncbi:MAG TPA: hypothetical protein VK034_03180 [Enhygromyxa sp.]|nr:hypothetical protein [Enhygromyxa sp.]
MTYIFTDDPAPVLTTRVDSTGTLSLINGTPQGDLITEAFSGGSVSVSIAPPRGWQLVSVVWSEGGNGTFSIPEPDVEETHPFLYTVAQNGTNLTGSGHFKIKKQSNGGGGSV